MTASAMVTIEPLGADTVEVPHASREIRFRRPHQQMKVVAHLTIGVDAPMTSLCDLAEDLQLFSTVVIFKRDTGALIATGRDVIKRVREFDSQGPGHGRSGAGDESVDKIADLAYPSLA